MAAQKHPLQRVASPSPSFSLLLHLLGLASFTLSFYTLATFETPVADQYGWHFQYLTIIGLSLATISFSCGLLADLTLSTHLFAAKNAVAVVAAPLEVLISLLYWGIRAIDSELLFPEEMRLALSADVGFHLAPAVVLALDLVLFSPPWTIRAYSAVGVSMALAMGYWAWVEVCFGKNGVYPYPLMGLLSTSQRALLFAFSGCLFTVSTIALKWMYGCINGIEKMQTEASKPLKKTI